jgi:hypothetical protein
MARLDLIYYETITIWKRGHRVKMQCKVDWIIKYKLYQIQRWRSNSGIELITRIWEINFNVLNFKDFSGRRKLVK